MIKRSYFFISHLYLLLFQTISAGEIGTFSILSLVEAAIAPREMKKQHTVGSSSPILRKL